MSGSYSRVSPAIGPATVIVGDQSSGTVFALSKATGALVWRTTLDSTPGAIITSSPVIVGSRIYVGVSSKQETLADNQPDFVPTFRGSMVALDLASGRVLWQTYIVPPGYTGGAVWSSNAAYDPFRQAVYLTTGNNYSVPASVQACQAAAGSDQQALNACLSPDDHIDSIMSLNANTGAINWAQRFANADTWTTSCISRSRPPATPCPTPTGLDVDFGAGPNLYTTLINGRLTDVVGAGQKKGVYYALDRNTGATLWGTQVGPDGALGGIEWGTATDGQRIYVANTNGDHVPTRLIPSGQVVSGGFWSALDQATGTILWQVPTLGAEPGTGGQPAPAGVDAAAEGSVSVANGVMYGEDTAGNFAALDGATGRLLWSFASGGSAMAGPAISGGVLYWGSGYASAGLANNKIYSFWLGVD